MGKLSIEYCDCCKKVGPTEKVFFMTDRESRSTEARHKSLHLCEKHLSELRLCFEAFRNHTDSELEIVLSTKTK